MDIQYLWTHVQINFPLGQVINGYGALCCENPDSQSCMDHQVPIESITTDRSTSMRTMLE